MMFSLSHFMRCFRDFWGANEELTEQDSNELRPQPELLLKVLVAAVH